VPTRSLIEGLKRQAFLKELRHGERHFKSLRRAAGRHAGEIAVKRVPAPLAFHDVRVRRDGKTVLRVNFRDDFGNVESGGNRRLQINAEQGLLILLESSKAFRHVKSSKLQSKFQPIQL